MVFFGGGGCWCGGEKEFWVLRRPGFVVVFLIQFKKLDMVYCGVVGGGAA